MIDLPLLLTGRNGHSRHPKQKHEKDRPGHNHQLDGQQQLEPVGQRKNRRPSFFRMGSRRLQQHPHRGSGSSSAASTSSTMRRHRNNRRHRGEENDDSSSISSRQTNGNSEIIIGTSRGGLDCEGARSSSWPSNYNHVHDVAAMNFEEAASERSRTRGKGKEAPLGVVGLRNLGNTCFLNSSLQCLSATIPLTDYFLGYEYRNEVNKDNFLGSGGKLATAYAELMKEMWLDAKRRSAVAPVAFKVQLEKFAPQFRGTFQHDAQELLSYLLDGIHEDMNRIRKKPYIEDRDCDGTNDEQDAIEAWKNYLRRDKSLIVDIFQGQLRNSLQCLRCGHKNIRFEPFMYLSLPISDKCRTLGDCLELYLAEEKLVGENKWYCSKCKKHRTATKKTDLWILPPILIVHLKRFKFNEYGMMGSKNEAPIDYKLRDWDLSKCVRSRGSECPRYDLYAVSNHLGRLGSGHYTAYSLNRFNDQWYEFNDSSCRRVSERTIKQNRPSAYLLFYNRTVGGKSGRAAAPLVRRQSVSRPDLWPHTQVQGHAFREFSRRSLPNLDITPPLTDSPGDSGADGEETNCLASMASF